MLFGLKFIVESLAWDRGLAGRLKGIAVLTNSYNNYKKSITILPYKGIPLVIGEVLCSRSHEVGTV